MLRPTDFHSKLLIECLRIIRPDGTIFLSTKNRYHIRLLLGGIGQHVEFRFGNALPHWLYSLLENRAKSSKSHGYLHSRKEVEFLFNNVDFSSLEPFFFLSSARVPKVVEKFDSSGLKNITEMNYWSRPSKKEKLFSRLPFFIQKHIASSHVHITVKPRCS